MWFQKISTPPPRRELEIPKGRVEGGQRPRKFRKGGGLYDRFSFQRSFDSVTDKTLTPSPWTTQVDYPDGLPKWTTPKNTTSDEYYIKKLRFYTYHPTNLHIFVPHGHSSAATLNNYTEITTAGHKKRRFKPHKVNFRSLAVGLSCCPIVSSSSDLH